MGAIVHEIELGIRLEIVGNFQVSEYRGIGAIVLARHENIGLRIERGRRIGPAAGNGTKLLPSTE